MSFTDQVRRIATAQDLQGKWGSGKPGANFRCYLCGHRFKVGDGWRWVYRHNRPIINFLTCDNCDGPDVLDRFVEAYKELKRRFWWATED